jgi:hypothetical protein
MEVIYGDGKAEEIVRDNERRGFTIKDVKQQQSREIVIKRDNGRWKCEVMIV